MRLQVFMGAGAGIAEQTRAGHNTAVLLLFAPESK